MWLRMSTTGVSPVTVMVSCRLLTRRSALMVMVPGTGHLYAFAHERQRIREA